MFYLIYLNSNIDEPIVDSDESKALQDIEEAARNNTLNSAYRAGDICEQYVDGKWTEMEYYTLVEDAYREYENTFSNLDEALRYVCSCREDGSYVSLCAEDIFEYDIIEGKWYRFG